MESVLFQEFFRVESTKRELISKRVLVLKLIPLKRLKHMPSRACVAVFLAALVWVTFASQYRLFVDPSGIAVGGSDLKKKKCKRDLLKFYSLSIKNNQNGSKFMINNETDTKTSFKLLISRLRYKTLKCRSALLRPRRKETFMTKKY